MSHNGQHETLALLLTAAGSFGRMRAATTAARRIHITYSSARLSRRSREPLPPILGRADMPAKMKT
jgi:hypothetical protein